MQVSVLSEPLFELRKAAAIVGSIAGKRPHKATLYRWASKGVAGVVLETVFINGTRMTSDAAIKRFFQLSTAAKNRQLGQPMPVLESQRQYAALEAQANDLGI